MVTNITTYQYNSDGTATITDNSHPSELTVMIPTLEDGEYMITQSAVGNK